MSGALAALPPPVAAVEEGPAAVEEVLVDVRAAGVLSLSAVEEEPVAVEEVVADVLAVEEGPVAEEEVVADVAAAGEVLDKDVAAGVM